MNDKQKNKRAIIALAIFMTVFLGYQFGFSHFRGHWDEINTQLAKARKQKKEIERIKNPTAKQLNTDKKLPVFEMPQKQDAQQIIFRNAIRDQVQKTGMKITTEPQYTATLRHKRLKFKVLKLQCKAQGSIQQTFDLLARVDENPNLIAFEDFIVARDAKEKNKMNVTFTATTFAKMR